jgi:hypothetical protein
MEMPPSAALALIEMEELEVFLLPLLLPLLLDPELFAEPVIVPELLSVAEPDEEPLLEPLEDASVVVEASVFELDASLPVLLAELLGVYERSYVVDEACRTTSGASSRLTACTGCQTDGGQGQAIVVAVKRSAEAAMVVGRMFATACGCGSSVARSRCVSCVDKRCVESEVVRVPWRVKVRSASSLFLPLTNKTASRANGMGLSVTGSCLDSFAERTSVVDDDVSGDGRLDGGKERELCVDETSSCVRTLAPK